MVYKKEAIYQFLLERINNAYYPAQTQIEDLVVADELGVSRTPVREALFALAQDGYLKALPMRGMIVVPFTYHDVSDIFEAREFIEPQLILKYGPSIPRELLEKEREAVIEQFTNMPEEENRPRINIRHHPHTLLFDACSNTLINSILERIERQADRMPNERPVDMDRPRKVPKEQILELHLALVDLMLAGDFAGAAENMKKHVYFGKDEYLGYYFR